MNFCIADLRPRVSCDQACADDYEAINLISNQCKNGCRAEYFIRPPLTITLKFPCNIDLNKVVLNGKIGCTTSVGFELLSYSDVQRSDTWIDCDHYNKHLDHLEIDSSAFRSVARLWSNDNPMVCFNNSHFRLRSPFTGLHAMSKSRANGSEALCALKHHVAGASLHNVTCLQVKVTRTLFSSVPGIAWIEVWGQPSLRCSEQLSNKMFTSVQHRGSITTENVDVTMRQSFEFSEILSGKSSEITFFNDDTPSKGTESNEEVTIPEEFLDQITFEIMSLPVLLPSGHCIDQYTLDRHNMEQARWGRDPNDPFTGVTLSDNSRPLPNSSLKVRIDSFLLKHSDTLTGVPQTLGRQTYSTNRNTSVQLKNSVLLNKSRKRSADDFDDSLCRAKKPSQSEYCNDLDTFKYALYTTKQSSDSLKSKSSFYFEDYPKIEMKKKQEARLRNDVGIVAHNVMKSSKKLCLDQALQSVLSGLPSYTVPAKPKLTKSVNKKDDDCYVIEDDTLSAPDIYSMFTNMSDELTCGICEQMSTINLLYLLPCHKVCCRQCVLKMTHNETPKKCHSCGKYHKRNSIQKAQK